MKKREQARKNAIDYAEEINVPVCLSWIDGSVREYLDAKKAVELCFIPRTARCIMGAMCDNKHLENMLNDLLDIEE